MARVGPSAKQKVGQVKYGAIIVKGSFAGLSVAIYLMRARRSVLILDTGEPRNRCAAISPKGLGARWRRALWVRWSR